MKTESETAVEKYFQERGLAIEKIAEGAERSPDYRVEIGGLEIIIEVKQFDATPDEQQRLESLAEGEVLLLDTTPGKGVRKKITDAGAQLKGLAKGKCPAVLLLFNNRPFLLGNPANPYEVRVAMYGFESILIANPRENTVSRVLDRKFGGSRKLTTQHNTTISAIMVMELRGEKTLLRAYHNEHAAIPLPHGLLSELDAEEFTLTTPESGKFQDWVTINGS